ncbi:phosphoribosylformylglycinamidine cyclo-ligase [Natranaerovirga hydrolytica]|uniref:Phosphoribosylformylglycinamidine cyclo-ligase n=1 Tax=Natranaerovirga hydrolytica TaxID=680378 RepID=A0A4R1MFP7_9FIRM|nr:phosphoribosylformylglycinamidine cyclo-ligase [Natranaerovirga hydrolytica]TCK90550.1 phosphoribosylformylglycinamidine cyclo-ligase [Natranaerovirga hydrolytica]
MDYKKAGVDIEAGYKAVELMKGHIKETMRPEVLTEVGGFSGLFSLANHKYEHPVLVSGTDGVGTKLKLAFLLDTHDTIGIDCVAMCVNDIACAGAEPLFFLDYIACGKNNPEAIANIVKGIAQGCKEAGAALVGGETAEMPGFYDEKEYDLAGFTVGITDKKDLINGENVEEGDVLLGITSSGIHSNGYSLVRKVFDMTKENLDKVYESLGTTLGKELLKPTKIYVKSIKTLKDNGLELKAISHITGGGFYENIPRMLKDGFSATINKNSYDVPAIFKLLQEKGKINEKDMYSTFNMGIGMVIAMSKEDAIKAKELLKKELNEDSYIIGEIKKGETGVKIC